MANVIKGLTVEIGGDTTKLGKALEDVNKKTKDLSSELGDINRLLKLDPGNTELLAQKQKVLADAIENTGKKLDTLKEAEKQVQQQFERGEVSEEQVRALQREIIATEKKMSSYEKAANETAAEIYHLGQRSDEAEDDVNELGDEAKKAGKQLDDAGDKASSFGDKAKKAGELAVKGFAAVGAAVGAAVVAMGKATVDAAAYADNILTMSTVTGVSTDELQAFSYASELVDVSVETLTKSMGKNIKSMKAVQDGTKLSVDAYKKLGVEALNADGTMRDGETVYWEVIDALGKMENETERDALAMQILGKSAQELNPLIEAGSEKMNELKEEAKEVGAVMSEEALAALGAFDDSIQRLKGSAGAAKNALGSVLLPEMQMLTDGSTDLLTEFTRNLNASGGGLEGFITTIDGMSGTIGSTLSGMITQLLDGIVQLAPSFVNVAVSLVTTLTTSLVSMIPQIITAGIDIIMALITGLTTAIPQVVQALVDMIPQLVNALVNGIPQLLQGAVQLLLAIVDAIPLIIPPLVAAIPQIVMAIINGLTTALPQLIAGAVQFLMAIVQAIPVMIEQLVLQIPTIITALIDGLLICIPQLLAGATQLLMAIVHAIPIIIQTLIPMIPIIVNTVITGLLNMLPLLLNGAIQLLMAIVEAIPIIIQSLIPMVPTIVDTVISGLLNMLPALLNGAVTLLMAIIDAIPQIIPPLIAALPDIILSIVETLLSNIPLLIKTAVELFLALVKAIPQVLGSIISGVGKIGTAILDYFKELPKKMLDIGKNLIKGLWNGIKNMASWVKNKISGFASDVLDGIKSFFGINSPSKETAWMGEMLDKGLAEGVLDNAKAPIKAMQRVAGDVLGAASGEVGGISFERQLSSSRATGAAFGAAAVDNSSMLAKLDGIYERLGRLQIVLDSGTLVGETIDKIDAGLAGRQLLSARGG